VKERPILFSAPMVRALLAGTKTQTRRELAPDLFVSGGGAVVRMVSVGPATTGIQEVRCPYGGSRLWVRETWAAPHTYDHLPPRLIPQDARIHYAATEERGGLLWRPSIHMPRWASRITLEVTGVRVERLQDISIADAMAEGVVETNANLRGLEPCMEWRYAYEDLWRQINGPDSWDANPWVWVIEFRRT
jgi:hypothetical protein